MQILLISFAVFVVIYIFFTQRIYSYNNFISSLLFAILFPCLSIAFNLGQSKALLLQIASFETIFPCYFLFLFLLKKRYKELNNFLIRKKLVHKKYENKEFTFVQGGESVEDYWDEKLAAKPSWLDSTLTLLLFIIPMFFIVLANKVIQAL